MLRACRGLSRPLILAHWGSRGWSRPPTPVFRGRGASPSRRATLGGQGRCARHGCAASGWSPSRERARGGGRGAATPAEIRAVEEVVRGPRRRAVIQPGEPGLLDAGRRGGGARRRALGRSMEEPLGALRGRLLRELSPSPFRAIRTPAVLDRLIKMPGVLLRQLIGRRTSAEMAGPDLPPLVPRCPLAHRRPGLGAAAAHRPRARVAHEGVAVRGEVVAGGGPSCPVTSTSRPSTSAGPGEVLDWFAAITQPESVVVSSAEPHLMRAVQARGFVPQEGPFFLHLVRDLEGLGPARRRVPSRHRRREPGQGPPGGLLSLAGHRGELPGRPGHLAVQGGARRRRSTSTARWPPTAWPGWTRRGRRS